MTSHTNTTNIISQRPLMSQARDVNFPPLKLLPRRRRKGNAR